jgi:hypothetical protein
MRGRRTFADQEYRVHKRREEVQMDDKRFDYLTRQVGQQADRRTMVKTAVGGTLALLGLAGFAGQSEGKNNNSRRTGFKDDPCATNDECLQGLTCEGARTGIAPGFPTPIDLPVITGKPGRCRYKKSCGGERGDVCRRNDDCCNDNGQKLTCDNNRCKRS